MVSARWKDGLLAGRNQGLRDGLYVSAAVQGDVEAPGEVTAKKSFRAQHAEDCRVNLRISTLCNFSPAQVGGSTHACAVIGEGQPQSAVWRLPLSPGHLGKRGSLCSVSTPYRLSCPACLQRLPQLVAHSR